MTAAALEGGVRLADRNQGHPLPRGRLEMSHLWRPAGVLDAGQKAETD